MKRSFRDRLHTGAGFGLLLFGAAFVALSLVALPGLPSNPSDRASALFFIGFGIVVGALPLLAGLGVLRGGRWSRVFATVVAALFGTVFLLAAMRIRQSGGSVSVGLSLAAAGVLFYLAASGNESNPGTFERNFDTRQGGQQWRVTGGTQLISIKMAQQLGSSVLLGAPFEYPGHVLDVR